MDFPGSAVVENLPSKAGHTDSIPDWGTKIPHAAEPRRLCTATDYPMCLGKSWMP